MAQVLERNLTVWKGDSFRLPIRLRSRPSPDGPYAWVDLTGHILTFEAKWTGINDPFIKRSDEGSWVIGSQVSGSTKGLATLTLTPDETELLPAVGVAVTYAVRELVGADEFTRLAGKLLLKAF